MGCIGGPGILTDDLVLCVDRADVVSYPGEPTYNYLDDPKDMTTGNWAIGNSAGQLERIGGFPDPFGGNNAIYFQQDAGSSYPHVRQYGVTDSTDQYTFSVWLKSLTGSTTVVICCFRQSPWTIYQQQVYTMTTSWVKYSMTFTPSNASAGSFHVIHQSGGAPAASYLIAYPQAEKNSHPTNFVMDSSRSRSTTAGWKDLSGNGNHVNLNSLTYTSATTQVPEKREFTFTQSSNNYTSRDNLAQPISMTSCAWIYPTNGNGGIFNSLSSTNKDGFYFGFYDVYNPTIYAADSDGGDWGIARTSSALTDSTWNYVCAVMNGSDNTGHVYINGALISSGNLSGGAGGWYWGSNDLQIGGNMGAWNSNVEFDGKIEAVQIYHDVLTTAEIKSNFDAQRGRFGL